MTWHYIDRMFYNDSTGEVVVQYNVQMPPEEYDAIAPPYKRYEVVIASGLTETLIGEHHFGSWDETISELHDGRCDGQPPA